MSMREHKLFKVNQAAILQNAEGRILILRKDGKWMLPGGRMEDGENWFEGLSRELREETGIVDFTVVRPASVGTSDSQDTYLANLLCRVEGTPEVVLSSEHEAYEWVGLESLDKFNFWHPSIPERIKLALGDNESYYKKDAKRGVDPVKDSSSNGVNYI